MKLCTVSIVYLKYGSVRTFNPNSGAVAMFKSNFTTLPERGPPLFRSRPGYRGQSPRHLIGQEVWPQHRPTRKNRMLGGSVVSLYACTPSVSKRHPSSPRRAWSVSSSSPPSTCFARVLDLRRSVPSSHSWRWMLIASPAARHPDRGVGAPPHSPPRQLPGVCRHGHGHGAADGGVHAHGY